MAIGIRILLPWMAILAPWVAVLMRSLEKGKLAKVLMVGLTVQ